MDKKLETQLFDSLVTTQPRLKEWLQSELASRIQVLVQMLDAEQLRRTQGYAQCLQNIINRLDEAAARRR